MTKPLSTFLNAADPVEFAKSIGVTPDPWQETVLRSGAQLEIVQFVGGG